MDIISTVWPSSAPQLSLKVPYFAYLLLLNVRATSSIFISGTYIENSALGDIQLLQKNGHRGIQIILRRSSKLHSCWNFTCHVGHRESFLIKTSRKQLSVPTRWHDGRVTPHNPTGHIPVAQINPMRLTSPRQGDVVLNNTIFLFLSGSAVLRVRSREHLENGRKATFK